MTREEIQLIISGQNAGALTALKGTQQAAAGFADGTIGHFRRVTGAVFSLQNAVIGAGAAMAARLLIKPAMDMETAETQLGVLLQDTAAAAKLMEEMLDFSAATPFQFGDLQKSAQQLLAVGFAAKDITAELRTLGDIAQGDGAKLDTVTRAYTKMAAKGRVSLEELNMLTEAGIPILAELAKGYGISTAELFKMITAGKVGFGDVQTAMIGMTSEGGQFFGMMEKMSETSAGLASTLKDNVSLALSDIGAELLPEVNSAMVDLIAVIGELRESGQLQEWGEEAGAALRDTLAFLAKLAAFVIENRELLANLGVTYAVVKTIFAINTALKTLRATMLATAAASGGMKAAMLAMAGPAGIGLLIAAATMAALKLRAIADEANELYEKTRRMENSAKGRVNSDLSAQRQAWDARWKSNGGVNDKGETFVEAMRRTGGLEKAKARAGVKDEPPAPEPAPPPPPVDDGPTPEQKAAADRLKQLREQEKTMVEDAAAEAAEAAETARREGTIAEIDDEIRMRKESIAAIEDEAAALEKRAAAAKQAADAAWANVVAGRRPDGGADGPDARRAAREQGRRDRDAAKAEARAEAELAEARRLQKRKFALTGRQRDLIAADNARAEAKALADILAGEEIKKAEDRKAIEDAKDKRDKALARFAEQDFAAKMDREHEKLEEIRREIAALAKEGGLPPGSSAAPSTLDPYPIAEAVAGAINAAIPEPPRLAPDYSVLLGKIAANGPLIVAAIEKANYGMGS